MQGQPKKKPTKGSSTTKQRAGNPVRGSQPASMRTRQPSAYRGRRGRGR